MADWIVTCLEVEAGPASQDKSEGSETAEVPGELSSSVRYVCLHPLPGHSALPAQDAAMLLLVVPFGVWYVLS
jgi:hypothetical protein